MNEIDEILANIDIDEKENPIQAPVNSTADAVQGMVNEPPAVQSDDTVPEVEPVDSEISEEDLSGVDINAPIEARQAPLAEIPHVEHAVKGTKTWNTREPYVIKINIDSLRKDRSDLNQSFYFVEEPGKAENDKRRINQEIVKFLRRPEINIIEQYADFICRNIIIIVQNISKSFELGQDIENYFVYHIGPLTVYRILKDELINKKYGFCYKYMPGNKAVKYFPAEVIKETIMKWFADNINVLDMPFDSIQKLEEMRSIAQKKYQNDLRIFNTRLDQLHAKIGPNKTISRHKLLQFKGNQWFGFQNMEIYRRFLGSSIFI